MSSKKDLSFKEKCSYPGCNQKICAGFVNQKPYCDSHYPKILKSFKESFKNDLNKLPELKKESI